MKKLLLCIAAILLIDAPVHAAQTRTILAVGDSKTYGYGGLPGYPTRLVSDLNALQNGTTWIELLPRLGHSGFTLYNLMLSQAGDIASIKSPPTFILLDIGTIDVRPCTATWFWHGGVRTPAIWQAKLIAYLQTWHNRFPSARIGLAFPRRYDRLYLTCLGWYVTFFEGMPPS